MYGSRMRSAGPLSTALLVAALAVGAPSWASSGHEDEAAMAEPVPTGHALVERCEKARRIVDFTHAQLKARNTFGRLDYVRAQYGSNQRFLAAHCGPDARGDDHGDDHGDDMHDAPHHDASRR